MEKALMEIEYSIHRFAKDMFAKMKKKFDKGYRGWNHLNFVRSHWKKHFYSHVKKAERRGFRKKDVVDIANYCLMLWHFRNRTNTTKGGLIQ